MFKSILSGIGYGSILIVIHDRVVGYGVVEGSSMEPTLVQKQIVLINKLRRNYKHNEIGCFRSPSNPSGLITKRVVGLGGDLVRVRVENPYDDDLRELLNDELGIELPNSYRYVKIPSGYCWVQGDNPSTSYDSRQYGPLPLAISQGVVTHILWPPEKMGRIKPENETPLNIVKKE